MSAHLRAHKISQEEKVALLKELFPQLAHKTERYREAKRKMGLGERIPRDEFLFVKATDQRYNDRALRSAAKPKFEDNVAGGYRNAVL